jgi:Flp pilus assembly pilin Flp
MKRFVNQLWQEDDGVLSFEWVLIITLVVIGIVGGLAAARDAIIDELGDIAEATLSFDQSYSIPAMDLNGDLDTDDPGEGEQVYVDDAGAYVDCARGNFEGQPERQDEIPDGA